ncbi:MAG: 3-methylornithine--L-lysine ligase PylC [Actinobacteria bacterium]|nr:3-methylornithine--L-lysine ligase PylC [Actinomycetota bacterium]
MRLGIVGGKLQGTEAAYLARKAGYEVVLVDRRPGVPAAGLADEVHELDVTIDEARARHVLTSCDAVLPACEDDETLEWLDEHVQAFDMPLLFDLDSYAVTSSKLRSNELFDRLGVPRPSPWPACGFPLIVKPSSSSGSEGVRLVDDEAELEAARAALEADGHEVVIEEYAPGPSLSLEVIGWGGEVAVFQPTLLEFDRYYDCKRVVAPIDEVCRDDRDALPGIIAAFDEIGRTLASGLDLRGIMDIEVMLHGGELKVLEIDARLPSQTPTAVLHSSGVNLLEVLVVTVLGGRLPAFDRTPHKACCYQHVRVAEGVAEVLGEHMMGGARPLRLIEGFHGADEAIVDRPQARAAGGSGGGAADEWVATLITSGSTPEAARLRAVEAVMGIAAADGLTVRPESTAMPGDECR